ncbi:hypothetical protein OAQ99_06010 [Candidatus Kapabacteria bacterium]|nr:hypothetical protein [Candidatus Kapabacteria bacterium]
MKQLIGIILFITVLACDDNGGNSPAKKDNLEFTNENIIGKWELQSRVLISYDDSMTIVSKDTVYFDHIIDMTSDNYLSWGGSIYHDWGDDTKQRVEYGNGEGTWYSVKKGIDSDKISEIRIYLDEVYKWEEENRTQNLSVFGILDELTNENMKLVQHIIGPHNGSRTDYFNLKRVTD